MNNNFHIRRQILGRLEQNPAVRGQRPQAGGMLTPRLCVSAVKSRREFADRHFRRADAFVLGMFAGAALITIGFAIACFFSR